MKLGPKALSELRLSDAAERNWLKARNTAQRKRSHLDSRGLAQKGQSYDFWQSSGWREGPCKYMYLLFYLIGQVNYYTK